MVKPVKFTRGSGCVARNEFLVIFKGDHFLIYMHLYLTPKRKVISEDEVWYAKSPIGRNTRRKIVQDMCKDAGIERLQN